MASINSFVREITSHKCGRAAPGLKEVRGDTFLGCDPDRHYNRASARVCYPGTTEAGRVGGRGDVRILCQLQGFHPAADDGAVCDELTASA